VAIYRWELPELTITQELIAEFQLQSNLRDEACGSQEKYEQITRGSLGTPNETMPKPPE
jgi:hypothetical protein